MREWLKARVLEKRTQDALVFFTVFGVAFAATRSLENAVAAGLMVANAFKAATKDA
ncbi:MAG: hypothetical protein ACRC8G_12750 [Plesiomonas shigelloides]